MYDIIIIGAGTAGIAAYKEAIKYTQNLLIVNDGPWDTTCARVGCMPSKVLIASANRMHNIQHAHELALTIDAQLDASAVMHRVRLLRDQFTSATQKDVDRWPEHHKISGRASFIDHQTIQVNDQHYQAKTFILAVGSTPTFEPKLKAELQSYLLTSDQIFELECLPKSLAVIGSGVIALELAQAMHRLGVNVDIFARSRKVGSLTSTTLQALAQHELGSELNIHFEVLPDHIQKNEHDIEISFTEHGESKTIHVEYVLNATGRRSLLSTLDLQHIDSQYQNLTHLNIDPSTKQLGEYPIFVVGDAYTTTPIQHEAAHEGREAVYNCLNYPQLKNLKTLTPFSIVFSQPEMAIVGKSAKQLQEEGINYVCGYVDYSKQGRATVMAENKGAIELYIEKETRLLIGAELFVTEAEHLAHLLAWTIDSKLTLDELLKKPFYHPTLEEGLRTALKHARRQLNTH
ncbi:dihydrolipoyl dehydrogenase [Acinetobacter sp. ANC 4558]|uniref:dihydrolipoyl dehydrogenase n=1 Tax=Acinetobacter sp. ANC 4558 TaxID=1977876 RepID=UPI000A32B349|nr:dihydrolipoyl dehydrogenase [Acinetobacter sp. ANC 4558]OTG83159.1 dihydrolipoyl dehydrogenase [Acinetobacter sp. ANC 4558]